VSNPITAQLIRYDLPGFALVIPDQAPEEPLCGRSIPLCLKIYINDFAILVDSPPQIMLLAVYLHKNFINVEGVSVASVIPLQSSSVNSAKLDTPEADRFSADGDSSLREEILYVPVTQVESIVEPDSIGNDVRWKSVTLIRIHVPILLNRPVNLAIPSLALI